MIGRAGRGAIASVVAAAALWGLIAPPGAAQAPEADGGRVLVVSMPGVTWADIASHDLPALEAFLANAAVADLAPRGVSPRSGPGDAYLTISAGTRATTERTIDGQVLALDEQSSGSAAGEIFTRRTGVTPHGQWVALAWPALVRTNRSEPYDAELGLLAETLAEAGIRQTCAIGNADGTDSIGASFERQIGLAVADGDGVVSCGALGADLVVDDPVRPFGRRLDVDKVVDEFRASWGDGADRQVVFVEASDLARTLRYRPMVDAARHRTLWDQALVEADALLAGLLPSVDERDTVLVVAPYNLPGDRDLTVVGLQSPGVEPGYLRSASTQRAGFLTLVDIAPTILERLDIDRPTEMEGRPAEAVASSASFTERVEHLVDLNAASRFRERLLFPTTMVAVVVLALLAATTVVVHVSGRAARWRPVLRFGALADLAVMPLSYLARGFDLEALGIGFYWAFVLVGAMTAAAAATALARRVERPRLALHLVLAFVALVLVIDVMTGSKLSLSAAFGYSPTGNSRLYGISNYSYGQLSAAACLLAAFLAGTRPERRARVGAMGVLGATLVVLGVPKWGSDVGGVLAFTPAIGAFAAVLYGWRIRIRTVLAAGVATAVAITAFGLLDLARPEGERAHLGRLFERVGDEGLEPLLSIMQRKLLANLEVSTSSLWVAAIPVAIAFWAFVVRAPRPPIARLKAGTPTLLAGLAGASVAAVLGSLVNDSGAIVGGVAATVLTASLIWLTLEPAEA